jgi:hypothetical protein
MHSILVKVDPEKALFGLSSPLRAGFAANGKIWAKSTHTLSSNFFSLLKSASSQKRIG